MELNVNFAARKDRQANFGITSYRLFLTTEGVVVRCVVDFVSLLDAFF